MSSITALVRNKTLTYFADDYASISAGYHCVVADSSGGSMYAACDGLVFGSPTGL